MKKVLALVLVLMLGMSSVAFAVTFTHPETGENVTVTDQSSIFVYGSQYFAAVPASMEFRGVKANGTFEMGPAVLAVGASLDAQLSDGTIDSFEIVGLGKIISAAMYNQILALDASEQLLVTLVALGYSDVVSALINDGTVTLSTEALDIIGELNSNSLAVDAALLASLFPVTEIDIGGTLYMYNVIEIKIVEADGTVGFERYGFRLTSSDTWVLERITVSVI